MGETPTDCDVERDRRKLGGSVGIAQRLLDLLPGLADKAQGEAASVRLGRGLRRLILPDRQIELGGACPIILQTTLKAVIVVSPRFLGLFLPRPMKVALKRLDDLH